MLELSDQQLARFAKEDIAKIHVMNGRYVTQLDINQLRHKFTKIIGRGSFTYEATDKVTGEQREVTSTNPGMVGSNIVGVQLQIAMYMYTSWLLSPSKDKEAAQIGYDKAVKDFSETVSLASIPGLGGFTAKSMLGEALQVADHNISAMCETKGIETEQPVAAAR